MSYVRYDSSLIQEFAEKMHSQANAVVIGYTLFGLIGGGAGAYALAHQTASPHPLIGGGILVVGILGYLVAQPRAFFLRLQAQLALCQMKMLKRCAPRQRAQSIRRGQKHKHTQYQDK